MSFSPDFLDEIRSRVPLADVVGRRMKLEKRGREYTGLCPFHSEKTPSFTLSEEKGFYHCFGCGAHGDVIGFVMQTEGLSFPEAVEKLAGEAGLQMPERSPEERQRAKQRAGLQEVLETACQWFQKQLAGSDGAAARGYLEKRGVSRDSIAAFRLGFAPDRRGGLRTAMNGQGIDDDLLVQAGLMKRPEDGGELRDYFFDRIIFPITDRRGRVIAFGGRAMNPEAKAKYLNSPDTELFHKGRVLYNLARARQGAHDTGEVIVCEGYMDVIALAEGGFPGGVAPLGTAVTEDQIRELWRLADEPIVCLDGDPAGQRAGYRAAERALALLRPGKSIRFAVLPAGEDPDSLIRGQGPQAMREVLQAARPLADVLWAKQTADGRFDTPERVAALKTALLDDVDRIQDSSVREAYRNDVFQRFDRAFGRARRGGGGRRTAGGGLGGALARRTGLAARLSPLQLRRRQEQAALAALVNHPEVMLEVAEELAGIEFSSADLDGFRRALLDSAADHTDLDTEGLRRQLTARGFGGVLEALARPEIYLHAPYARPGVPAEEVLAGWRHFRGSWEDQQRQAARRDATRHLAETMNEDALEALKATQEMVPDGDSGTSGRKPRDGHDGGSRKSGGGVS